MPRLFLLLEDIHRLNGSIFLHSSRFHRIQASHSSRRVRPTTNMLPRHPVRFRIKHHPRPNRHLSTIRSIPTVPILFVNPLHPPMETRLIIMSLQWTKHHPTINSNLHILIQIKWNRKCSNNYYRGGCPPDRHNWWPDSRIKRRQTSCAHPHRLVHLVNQLALFSHHPRTNHHPNNNSQHTTCNTHKRHKDSIQWWSNKERQKHFNEW